MNGVSKSMLSGIICKNLRLQKGYTIAVVAHYTGVTEMQVSNYENNRKKVMSSAQIDKMIVVLQSDYSADEQSIINKAYYQKRKTEKKNRLEKQTLLKAINVLIQETSIKEKRRYFLNKCTEDDIKSVDTLITKLEKIKIDMNKKIQTRKI